MPNEAGNGAEWIEDVAARGVAGSGATREEALMLADPESPLPPVMRAAARVRAAHLQNTASLCAIVNARSGRCGEDCRYCAQSAHYPTRTKSYPILAPGEIVEAAAQARETGASCFGIVTSGGALDAGELAVVVTAVERIARKLGMRTSASLGMLGSEALRRLRDAGLGLYHHNLETSERFFPKICTTHGWSERAATIRAAQAAGLPVCSGGLFGLGETWADRADLALALRGLGVKSVPLNFLHPIPGTPFADAPPMDPAEILRTIALFRLILPAAHIRVCGGRSVNLGDREEEIYAAGASGMMVGNYLTTPGRSLEADHEMLRRAGMRW